ncbi:MAG: hypothetical protein ACT4TC_14305 [Myxococcaceae bacterium]
MTSSPDKHAVPLEPEEDKLPYGSLVLVAALSLIAFFVGGLWSTYILLRPHNSMNPEMRAPLPVAVNQYEVGIVNQKLFTGDVRAEEAKQTQVKALHSYGWVDRSRNVIHIPIEEAMKQLAEGKR